MYNWLHVLLLLAIVSACGSKTEDLGAGTNFERTVGWVSCHCDWVSGKAGESTWVSSGTEAETSWDMDLASALIFNLQQL